MQCNDCQKVGLLLGKLLTATRNLNSFLLITTDYFLIRQWNSSNGISVQKCNCYPFLSQFIIMITTSLAHPRAKPSERLTSLRRRMICMKSFISFKVKKGSELCWYAHTKRKMTYKIFIRMCNQLKISLLLQQSSHQIRWSCIFSVPNSLPFS